MMSHQIGFYQNPSVRQDSENARFVGDYDHIDQIDRCTQRLRVKQNHQDSVLLCGDFNSQRCDNNSHLWRHDMSGTSCTLSFSALIVGVDAHCEMFFFDSRSTSNISRQEKRPPQTERPKYYLDVPNPAEENDDDKPL